MSARLESFYRSLVDRKAHALLIYLMAATILLVSVGGIVSSTTLGLLVLLGLFTIRFDATIRRSLFDAGSLGPLTLLLVCVLVWQALGLALRNPPDRQAASVLGSAAGIAMLLPLLFAAARRDSEFRTRLFNLLFILGCIAAAISLARYFILIGKDGSITLSDFRRTRLVPIGRASHQILGAGGLAACFFAGLAIYPKAQPKLKLWIAAGLGLIAVTIAFTQSRGPMIGLGLAILAMCILELFRAPARRILAGLVLALLCFGIPVALIVAEPWIKDLACPSDISMCRPSNRQDVWAIVVGLIEERPWFGIGPTFRFPDGAVSHPHNGMLGLIFYFGLPMAVLFVGIIAFAVVRTAVAPPGPSRSFALLGIFFSMSFVATDLANPFAFVNTLYLYLWLPVFIGALSSCLPEDGQAARADAGIP